MKNKFTTNYFFFVLVFLSISLISFPIKAQDKSKDDEISKLHDKIEMLGKKMQNQANEINNLKKEVENMKKRKPMLAVPDLKNENNLRKGKRFEFNGQVYYMVPLNTDNKKNNNDK